MPRIILLILFLFMSVAGWAQETPSPSPTPEEVATPTVSPTVSPTPEVTATPTPTPDVTEEPPSAVEEFYRTPRQSLEHFMEVMELAGPLRPDLYLLARRHLDLSQVPTLVREEKGITLSQQLYAILVAADLRLDKLEEHQSEARISVYRQPSGNQIFLEKQEDGRWLFSSDTVAVIPDMYKVLTDKGKIAVWRLQALDYEILGVNGNVWLALLLLPVLGYAIGSLFVFVLRFSVGRLLNARLGVGVERQKAVLRPLGWLLASLVVWIGLSALQLPDWLHLLLTAGIKIVATLSAVVSAFRLSDEGGLYMAGLTSRTVTRFDDMLIPLARRTFKTLVGILAVLFLAQNLDIEVWSLFAGFSIFGAMVALAGQDMVKNFFGSITVLVDQPFAVGDWIVVEGIEGVVEDVGFRSTRIRTFYDSVISLPNSRLITAHVDNYGLRRYRRYTKKLRVRWNTAPEKLEAFCEGIREIIRKHPYTRKDSYQVWVNDVNDYALEILLFMFFVAPDWNTELRERHRLLVDIHRLARELDIELAYPSQKLLLARHEDNPEDHLDLEAHQKALEQGKESTRGLLKKSLPADKPPPAVVE